MTAALNKDTRDTWHILGPGAIGCLFACHLQQAGLAVRLIGRRPEHGDRRIRLNTDNGEQEQVFAPDHPAQPITHLLITVKAHQTTAALQAVRQRLTAQTLIVLMQNGMGTWQALQDLPTRRIVVATTTEGAHRPAADRVIHAGRGETWVGALDPRYQADAARVCRDWSATGLVVKEDPEILHRLWQKLAINCAINPLTVLYDCPNGALLNNTEALELMQQVCREVEQVMGSALGEKPSGLFELAKAVSAKTSSNISSMLQDVRKQQQTEIDHITGYLLDQARRLGIACPCNERILKQIKAR